jgi:hypothetical protein
MPPSQALKNAPIWWAKNSTPMSVATLLTLNRSLTNPEQGKRTCIGGFPGAFIGHFISGSDHENHRHPQRRKADHGLQGDGQAASVQQRLQRRGEHEAHHSGCSVQHPGDDHGAFLAYKANGRGQHQTEGQRSGSQAEQHPQREHQRRIGVRQNHPHHAQPQKDNTCQQHIAVGFFRCDHTKHRLRRSKDKLHDGNAQAHIVVFQLTVYRQGAYQNPDIAPQSCPHAVQDTGNKAKGYRAG